MMSESLQANRLADCDIVFKYFRKLPGDSVIKLISSIFILSSLSQLVFSSIGNTEADKSFLNGTVHTSTGCSGAVIKLGRAPGKLYVLTNGHCVPEVYDPNNPIQKNLRVVQNVSREKDYYDQAFDAEYGMMSVSYKRLVYGTMDQTDLALLEPIQTEQDFRRNGVQIFQIDSQETKMDDAFLIPSSHWEAFRVCKIKTRIPIMTENQWTFSNALLMDDACLIVGGWSGSPVISKRTGKITAIVNSGNGSDHHSGPALAQRVQDLTGCVTTTGIFQLNLPSCRLPKNSY